MDAIKEDRKYFNKSAEPWENILPNLFKIGDMPDLILVAREGGVEERIPINSTWITIKSPGIASAVNNLENRELVFQNTTPRVMNHVLNYIYYSNFKKGVTIEDLLNLLEFDKVYRTGGLTKKCLAMLEKKIKVKNALDIWRKTNDTSCRDLHKKVEDFIVQNLTLIFELEDWICMTVAELSYWLRKDELTCSEIDIFNSALRWGDSCYKRSLFGQSSLSSEDHPSPKKEELRAVLADIIPLIRFPIMRASDFADFVTPSNLLTTDERLAVFEYICASAGSKPSISFNTNPRMFCPPSPTSPPTEFSMNRVEMMNMMPQQQSNLIPNTNNTINNSMSALKIATEEFFAQGPNLVKKKIGVSPKVSNPSSRTNRRGILPSFDCDEKKEKQYVKTGDSYLNLEDFIEKFSRNRENLRNLTTDVILNNVTLENYYTYSTVILKNMFQLELNLNCPIIHQDKARFERLFDIRRLLFYRRSETHSNDVDLTLLWDEKVKSDISLNGVTMLRINPISKELTIGFRNDSNAILSGLRKSEKLLHLNLMKTDVPRFEGFPCKHLKEILFYHVWSLNECDVGDFVRKCSSLSSFSCWAICPWWENRKSSKNVKNSISLYSPTELDLAKDLVSGQELKYLALCKVVLILPHGKIIKEGLTELYLDTCFWPDQLTYSFHITFPNLRKCAIKQKTNETVRHNFNSFVNYKLLYNIIKITSIEWIRIWGANWNDMLIPPPEQGSPTKQLRSKHSPVSSEEIAVVQSLLQSCGLPEDADNFLLEKDADIWTGKLFNDKEPREYDNGFWDLMDRYDFEYFKLRNLFKDHQTHQNNFIVNLELP